MFCGFGLGAQDWNGGVSSPSQHPWWFGSPGKIDFYFWKLGHSVLIFWPNVS